METIVLSGNSKENSLLLLRLARKLNFNAKKLSNEEVEEIGIAISIQEGIQSGFLNDAEKLSFLEDLKKT